ncbi:hypothetical protein F5X98DRAFT_379642 [Xylaria grammica]|nr:hypothetical protein F5X98DRAFT_379642 [Xylaria grammica]
MNKNDKRKRPAGSDASETMQKRSRELTVEDDTDESSTEESSEDDFIESEREQLRVHAERQSAFFFVERSPQSGRRGAGCQFISCEEKIQEGDYRIAVCPGTNKKADFYHIRCFEKLADFSEPECLKRLQPVTRATFFMRELKTTSVADGNYLVDGGAEKLILHWISSMGRLTNERDGLDNEPGDLDLVQLVYKAGSASFTAKRPEGIEDMEYLNLLRSLAPIESDGPGDTDEWNLIEEYSPLGFDDLDDLKQTDSLSSMLEKWRFDSFLAASEEGDLSEKGKELRNKLGEKAIRAIRRLYSCVEPPLRAFRKVDSKGRYERIQKLKDENPLSMFQDLLLRYAVQGEHVQLAEAILGLEKGFRQTMPWGPDKSDLDYDVAKRRSPAIVPEGLDVARGMRWNASISGLAWTAETSWMWMCSSYPPSDMSPSTQET